MRMKRLRKLIPSASVALLGALAFALPASANVAVHPVGAADFVFGQSMTLGLHGAPSQINDAGTGSFVYARGFPEPTTCPDNKDSGGPVYAIEGFVRVDGTSDAVSPGYPAVVNSMRDVRFCFYEYSGRPEPPLTYSQVVHFRDPSGSFSWFEVTSADSPERPYLAASGHSETGGAPQFAFVPVDQQCPATFPAGGLSVSFASTGVGNFVKAVSAPVGVGFWRACGYIQGPSTSPLLAQSTFSLAPRGGWKPSYALSRGSLRAKAGRYQLGSATCPATCSLQVVAKSGKKTLASGRVSGDGKLSLSAKLSSAGRKAVKRGVKATVTVTAEIDASQTSKSVKLKLR
jgi:hypothetical protein